MIKTHNKLILGMRHLRTESAAFIPNLNSKIRFVMFYYDSYPTCFEIIPTRFCNKIRISSYYHVVRIFTKT